MKRLLALSLLVIPFYEIILYFIVPGRSMPEFQDMRVTKDFLVMAFSIAIGLFVLYRDGFNPFKSKFILFFLLFFVWNIYKAPPSVVLVNNVNFDGMWNFMPFCQALIMFLFLLGIINDQETACISSVQYLMKAIYISGFIMAVYMIIQKIGIDQIFSVSLANRGSFYKPFMQEAGFVAGSLGNQTFASPFIAMTLPFAYYFRKYVAMAVMVLAACLTESSFGIAGVVVVLWGIGFREARIKKHIYIILSVGLLFVVGILAYLFLPWMFDDGSRFSAWKDVIKHCGPFMAMTGMGIGSFKYLYGVRESNGWFQAHNEYLQLFWACGIVGLGIFVMFVRDIFLRLKHEMTREKFVVMASLAAVLFCGCGTFIFQLAVFQYYIVVLVGMAHILTREVNYGKE